MKPRWRNSCSEKNHSILDFTVYMIVATLPLKRKWTRVILIHRLIFTARFIHCSHLNWSQMGPKPSVAAGDAPLLTDMALCQHRTPPTSKCYQQQLFPFFYSFSLIFSPLLRFFSPFRWCTVSISNTLVKCIPLGRLMDSK